MFEGGTNFGYWNGNLLTESQYSFIHCLSARLYHSFHVLEADKSSVCSLVISSNAVVLTKVLIMTPGFAQ